MIDNSHGISRFPVVAGHEAVGVITALGDAVDRSRLTLGQRVGIGAYAGSCFACEWCITGRQHLCPAGDATVFRGDRGGFATQLRASDWRHVHPLPDVITSEQAGPLLCAGATVFSAIVRHDVRPTDRVAVVGVGGLGHLAIQFLAKWGCHVTAVSRSAEKADDARRFGAHAVVTPPTTGSRTWPARSTSYCPPSRVICRGTRTSTRCALREPCAWPASPTAASPCTHSAS
ncbi:alcohol dehydrogenase catalytic domain-containing protein [Streptomyces niger]|uniref:alcohol dehydrogenase catalytic domain-containing protein n=1 Tax=Streptomyces niger TaxID=66373 RepID=UPI001F15A421|nr:alcohol dehydrogenase catalytic domain-containing protein [Streptomyces niger]